jgi:hypothetical protein
LRSFTVYIFTHPRALALHNTEHKFYPSVHIPEQ